MRMLKLKRYPSCFHEASEKETSNESERASEHERERERDRKKTNKICVKEKERKRTWSRLIRSFSKLIRDSPPSTNSLREPLKTTAGQVKRKRQLINPAESMPKKFQHVPGPCFLRETMEIASVPSSK